MDAWVFTVVGIRPEARDTATIFLKRADGLPLAYRAGQFLTFLFSFGDRQVRRSYSFSSTPGVDEMGATPEVNEMGATPDADETASITVKRVVNGEVSRYLLDHLREGDKLLALPPAGRFVLERSEQFVFIAAGSGVVPVLSLIREALYRGEGQVLLLSQQHDVESVIFKKKLEEMTKKFEGRFRWESWLSEGGEAGDEKMAQQTGRLNNWLLEERLGQLVTGPAAQKALFYICGPESFMRMATFTLRVMGFDESRIKKEHFTVEYVPPPPLLADMTAKKVTIHAGDKTYQFETAWPKTILQAALDNHIPLPYSCKGGRCSSCVAKCIKGSVKMSINEVLTEKDIKEGLVLTCVGYAETEVELEISLAMHLPE